MDDVLHTAEEPTTETPEDTAASGEVTAEADDGTTAASEGETPEVTAEGAEPENAAQTETETEAAPFLTVQFQKQQKSLSRDETRTLAQKGLKWDAFTETYNKLSLLAEGSGYDSVDKLAAALMQSREDMELQKLTAELGEGKEALAREIFAARKAEREAKYKPVEEREREADEADEQSRAQTLAAQLDELKAEMPEYASMEKIPQAARRLAEEKGLSLLDAVLRYQLGEQKRARAEAEKQQAAAKASTGSLKGQPEEQDSDIQAFTAAFFGGLGR